MAPIIPISVVLGGISYVSNPPTFENGLLKAPNSDFMSIANTFSPQSSSSQKCLVGIS